MKRNLLILAVAALLAGCHININDPKEGDYPSETRTYSLDGVYKSLEVSSAFNVVMCDTITVPTVTIQEGMHDKVVFRVENRTLKIGIKPGIHSIHGELRVLLPYNEQLRKVELSGASHFTSNRPMGSDLAKIELSGASRFDGDLAAGKVEIDLSGASEYSGSIDAGDVDIDLSGASDATLNGTCNHEIEIELSGASHLDARDLDAVSVRGELSGASSANVLCCESLRVDLGGASHLTYGTVADGCEPSVNCNTTGGSTVRSR